jgi:hypothetical protein
MTALISLLSLIIARLFVKKSRMAVNRLRKEAALSGD